MVPVMTYDAPLHLHAETVRPDWIDYNGHMNVAYYVLAFDHAVDRLFDILGVGIDYVKAAGCSLFVLENHVTYLRELVAGDPMRFTLHLLDHDHKRLHAFIDMYHAEAGHAAATYEFLAVHVDLGERRSTPMPAAALARLAAMLESHRTLPRPAAVGSVIGIRR